MNQPDNRQVLNIKKYPNRRYYDATRSCHVTLHDVHELIQSGKDVCITDSRTGEEITNVVLAQIILERDPPKLDIFPASVFHIMIRSNRQALRVSVERVFAPFMGMLAASQNQFDAFVSQAMQGKTVSPLDWANTMMGTSSPGHPTSSGEAKADANPFNAAPPNETAPETDTQDPKESIDELRRQLGDLTRRMEQLGGPMADDEPASPESTG